MEIRTIFAVTLMSLGFVIVVEGLTTQMSTGGGGGGGGGNVDPPAPSSTMIPQIVDGDSIATTTASTTKKQTTTIEEKMTTTATTTTPTSTTLTEVTPTLPVRPTDPMRPLPPTGTTVQSIMTPASESNMESTAKASITPTTDMITDKENASGTTTKTDVNTKSILTTKATSTESPLIIIVGATAAIIIVIVLVTAICLCCICSRNAKSAQRSETNIIGNGIHKEQEIRDLESGSNQEKLNSYDNTEISKDSKAHNEADVYETTDEMDGDSSDVQKLTEKGKPNGTEVYSNQIFTDDESKSGTNRQSLRSDSTNEDTGNIFEKIDPTAEDTDELELSPKIIRPTDDVTYENNEPEKDEPREAVRRSGLKRNISNRNDNVLHQLKPRPRPRPRSTVPHPEAQNGNDTPTSSPPKSPETADSPSPRSSSGTGHQFRIPAKGKGPDGSDQAALLANVLRKSNAPRQVEDEEKPDPTGTTYW